MSIELRLTRWNLWPLTFVWQKGKYPDCTYYRVIWVGPLEIEWPVSEWGHWR